MNKEKRKVRARRKAKLNRLRRAGVAQARAADREAFAARLEADAARATANARKLKEVFGGN